MKEIVVRVVVVNYNAGACLAHCVRSVLGNEQLEVVVVDNGSSDGSLAELPTHPKLQVIEAGENLGFAKACNLGARSSSADYLLFLNPDCLIDPARVFALMAVLEASDQVGMVGPLLLNTDGTEQAGGRRRVPTPLRSFAQAFGLGALARIFTKRRTSIGAELNEPFAVEAISGACMLVKRIAVDEVGLWDEDYFLHCEDLDWCMRFQEKGWQIHFVPKVKVVHEKGVCSQARPVFVEWHKHRGMIRFYRKFFRKQYPLGLFWLVCLGVWFRFALIASVKSMKNFIRRSLRLEKKAHAQ